MFKRILLLVGILAWAGQAQADNYTATAGSGLTFAAKNVGGILFPWSIPANSSGTELFTTGNAGYVQFPSAQAVTGTFWQATQPVSGTFWQATQPVSGTVTANAGTNLNTSALGTSANQSTALTAFGAPGATACSTDTGSCSFNQQLQRMAQNLTTLNTTITTFQGTKNAGAAAANSLLAGGVYNSSPLTLTTGQQASFQFDANGYVKMNVAAGGAGGGAVYGPTANGSAAANPPVLMGGTATGGATGNVANATIKAGNTAATTDPAIVVADPNLLAAANAAIPTQAPTVSIGGVGIVDSAGTNVATVKAASTLPAATDKTLVVGLNPGTATAGTPTGAIVTVQGVSGGTAQPVALNAETTKVIGTVNQGTSPWVMSGTVQPGNTPNTTPWLVNNAGTLATGATFVHGTTAAMTGTTSTQVVALVSSNRLYITRIKCNNSSGTATLVTIQDGSGGTALDTLAAGATYGGEQGTGSTPLFWTTSGNGLYAADVTTGASVICTASGYSG